jgi:peptidoglycan/LPS O-acetylase OafA/YrhL
LRHYQLDGLRALALFMVLLIHHGLLRSGWAGVDIFFVLSGFLITGILRRDSETPLYWKGFYIKRAARILPPFLILFVVSLLSVGTFKATYLGYLLFAGNILQLTPDRLPLLGPLWSLAIEEHFYFLWPFAVKSMRRESLIRLSAAIVVLSPFVRMVGTITFRHWGIANTGWDNPIFLLTPFRVDGLAAGSALALLTEQGRRPAFLLRWSGTATIGAATLFLTLELLDKSFRRTTDNILFNGFGYSLVVLASFFLVSFLILKPQSVLARVLTWKPIVFIGSISYGFYLYQEAVIITVRSFIGTHVSLKLLFLPDFLVTAILATISFFLVERQFIAKGHKWLTTSKAKYRHERAGELGIDFSPSAGTYES